LLCFGIGIGIGAFAMPMLTVEGARSQEMVLNRASESSKSEGQSSEMDSSQKV
jgi:hypothetical protein